MTPGIYEFTTFVSYVRCPYVRYNYFLFVSETTGLGCIYRGFLDNIGVYDQGLWRREDPLEIPGMLMVVWDVFDVIWRTVFSVSVCFV